MSAISLPNNLSSQVKRVFVFYLFPDFFRPKGTGSSTLELKKLLARQEVLTEVEGYVVSMKRFHETIFPHFLVVIGRTESLVESLNSK